MADDITRPSSFDCTRCGCTAFFGPGGITSKVVVQHMPLSLPEFDQAESCAREGGPFDGENGARLLEAMYQALDPWPPYEGVDG